MKKQNLSAVAASLAVHVVALIALAMIKYQVGGQQLQMVLDSVFTEERTQEEFEQELDKSTEVAETMNLVAGSIAQNVANVSGGSGAAVAQQKVDESVSLKDPDFTFKPGPISTPGLNILSNDLGTGQVTGEVGRVVEGYGAALGQITQELIRMMREEKIHAVWMFDASESMEDDRREIRDNFHKVYEELGLATKSDDKLKASEEPILTSVVTFNTGVTELTAKPTSDVAAIRAAIDKIVKDESGNENLTTAITYITGKYGRASQSQKRKLVIIMASDESGDFPKSGPEIEDVIQQVKRLDTPVYFLGRYAVFGFPYARMTWKDPKYGLTHWLRIQRGPETAFPECLQFDGLHERWDVYSSGFGPYEQARLCRESGGIFFLLPGDETNISGRGSTQERKYEMLDMKEYVPDLSARVVYQKERDTSRFRAGLWQIIVKLNPFLDKSLNMREHHFPMDPAKFQTEGARNFGMAVQALKTLNEAHVFLNTLRPLRDKEQSMRWRAHFDLMDAQVLAYRVRLFQYILALDQHGKNMPKPKDAKSNEWHVRRVPKMLVPDPAQVKAAGVDLDELKEQEKKAREGFAQVIENHPRTPWAKLAQNELAVGFGIDWVEGYRDPRYDRVGLDIKLPNP